MRFRLRTLLIATMVGPPFVAVVWTVGRGDNINPALFSGVMWIIIVFVLYWLHL